MRWGEIETCKFVKIYLSHEYLWNSHNGNYKLKDKRLKAYQTIIKEFMSSTGIRLSESEVRVKIKNLRSTYFQEISKIRTRSIPNSPYIPTIKWFSDWHKCFKNRSKKSVTDDLVYDIQQLDDKAHNKSWITDNEMVHNNERNMELFRIQRQNIHYDIIMKLDPDATSIDTIESPYLYVKEKKLKLQNSSTKRTFRSSLRCSLESLSHEDEFDIYGKYIASQLRGMNLKKALRLQLEIASLVSEARIADLSKHH